MQSFVRSIFVLFVLLEVPYSLHVLARIAALANRWTLPTDAWSFMLFYGQPIKIIANGIEVASRDVVLFPVHGIDWDDFLLTQNRLEKQIKGDELFGVLFVT